MRIWIGAALLGAAIAAGGTAFVLASSASVRRDLSLAEARAFVDQRCPAREREISASMWQAGWRFNVLYGNCRAGDGRDQHAWFFDRGRFIGNDARTPSHDIIGLWRDDRTIALLYVLYRGSDPECCATGGGAIVRYRLGKGRVRRLDPLPPSAFKRGGRIGR